MSVLSVGFRLTNIPRNMARAGNTRIWQTYYEPKPLSELYTGWQEMLAEHRQIIVEVQEIAEETGWCRPK